MKRPATECLPRSPSVEAASQSSTVPAAAPGGSEAASAPPGSDARGRLEAFFGNVGQTAPEDDIAAADFDAHLDAILGSS